MKNHDGVINGVLSFLIKPDIRAQYAGVFYLEEPERNWGSNSGQFKILQVKTANLNSHFLVLDNVSPYDPWNPSVMFDRVLSVRYYDVAA